MTSQGLGLGRSLNGRRGIPVTATPPPPKLPKPPKPDKKAGRRGK